MRRIALFPGSFDPFTRGHEALVAEALRLFDEVVIAVGENVGKRALLDVQSRMQMIADIYRTEPRVRVASYSSLTGDFAREVGATALVRGVRNTIDFEYERTMEAANRELFPELTTVLLVTPAECMHISSSMVRELLAFGRSADDYIPQGVRLSDYIAKEPER